MKKKFFTSISLVVLIATLTTIDMLGKSATADTKDAVRSEACECSKLAWMKLFKDESRNNTKSKKTNRTSGSKVLQKSSKRYTLKYHHYGNIGI